MSFEANLGHALIPTVIFDDVPAASEPSHVVEIHVCGVEGELQGWIG